MPPTKTSAMSCFVLLLALGAAVPASAKCVFRKSCTRNAFKCFQPRGTCSLETTADGSAKLCWANKASISSASGVTTILGKRGRPCITGTIQRGSGGESEVAYVRNSKTWVLRNNLDG